MPASDRLTPTQNKAFARRMNRRRRADARFKIYGQAAVVMALCLLVTLLVSIGLEARSAFTRHDLALDMHLSGTDSRTLYEDIRSDIIGRFDLSENRAGRIELSEMVSRLASGPISDQLEETGVDMTRSYRVQVPLFDEGDLYLKGRSTDVERSHMEANLIGETLLSGRFERDLDRLHYWQREQIEQLRRNELMPAHRMFAGLTRQLANAPDDRSIRIRLEGAERRVRHLESRIEDQEAALLADELELNDQMPTILLRLENGWARAVSVSADQIRFEWLLEGAEGHAQVMNMLLLSTPELQRSISDIQIAAIETFRTNGNIRSVFNGNLFANGDSSESEFAGVLSGMIGSILIIIVTMALAVPVGIAAAVYLEEFAPRNALTSFIQVNINNLAAVPSIVFGLLGAAIFVNGVVIPIPFVDQALTLGGGLGRGWPLVGGIVLALMTMPTIIISSRAALASVPNSVRQAALAVGATRLQTINHHVLPIAAPGILTGSIIGLAQALGETAPLLLIGMVAFIGELPTGVTDRSTALPVLIFQWSTRAERAWEPMTSAAIIILLLLLLVLNAVAVWLRLRYEKR
ncbi:phosphate ABC transporter permease PstA [Ponticaulis sp.]|uniref:phosphate ABC transporter permease PstA n=1 Tax=Ponticaulis sp. TaxID=2020902 RepID=UPI000B7025AA|nr:phosphate ABC transporter permease PstA [Ponticaulis sp.]MAI90174.1 phosphate ABC transporter, permease protein PstA [Ponticaulis sp.]OUX99825.1 MAG: phosphate ABC transporter, permease protein PstA [Hyphomonadaceae bacterium TMED5]|tara:strand:+ start:137941 stop:139677 length:1737 start_codon:yes stop_codon:yes gene_type:complete